MLQTYILKFRKTVWNTGYLSLKYAADVNAAKALIMMTLSTSKVPLKIAVMVIAAKYQLQILQGHSELTLYVKNSRRCKKKFWTV